MRDQVVHRHRVEALRVREQRLDAAPLGARKVGLKAAKHGTWIALSLWTGFTFVGSDNAGISHLVVTGDRWIIRRFNDTAHLGMAFTTAAQPPT